MSRTVPTRGDIVSGAVLAGLGIYIIVAARGWDYTTPDGPGPGFFPLWYGITMLVLSIVLVVTSLRRRMHENGRANDVSVNWHEVGNAVFTWVALAVCIGFLKLLGFALSFGLMTFFVVAFMYRRSLKVALATAVGCSLGFYLVFPLALNVSLPVGIFGF